jgi:hypothetical protein
LLESGPAGPERRALLNMEAPDLYNSRSHLPIKGQAGVGGHPALDVVAMTPLRLAAVPVRGYGPLIVGRSPRADIALPDDGVCPEHARITVAPGGLTIEDLGSRRGTFLHEVPLAPGEPARFLPGEPVRVGGTVLMVRRRTARLALRRLWSAAAFARLVEDECLRAHQRPEVFAVVHVELAPVGDGRLADLLRRIDGALPPPHLLGAAPGAGLQALLVAVPPSFMQTSLRRLFRGLREGGYEPGLGTAWYPADGRRPDRLCTLARRRAGARDSIDIDVAEDPGDDLCPVAGGIGFIRESTG